MFPLLKAPPLVEALFELQLNRDAGWDWTVPGRIFERIESEFSEKSEAINLQGQVLPIPAERLSEFHRVQLKRPDRSAMVQIGANLLAVNHFPPYPGWERFRDLILRVVGDLTNTGVRLSPARVALRYINLIRDLPGEFEIRRAVTTLPSFRGVLNRPGTLTYQRSEFRYDNPQGFLTLQSGNRFADAGGEIVLDLDFASIGPQNVGTVPELLSWLDAAHQHVEDAFVAALTDEMYARFKTGAAT